MIEVKISKKEKDLIQLARAEEKLKAIKLKISTLIDIIDGLREDMPEYADELYRDLNTLRYEYENKKNKASVLKNEFIKKYVRGTNI